MPFKDPETRKAYMRNYFKKYRERQRNHPTVIQILKEQYPHFLKFLKQEYNVRD